MTLAERFKIYDSLLPQDEYNGLRQAVRDPEKIKWSWQASNPDQGEPAFLICNVQDDPFYNSHLLSYVQGCLTQTVKPIRIYYNCQQPNCHGSYHEDDGDVTAILYINGPPYQPSWGGWTELYDRGTGEHEWIHPLDNRLLLLDAKLTHRGLAFLSNTAPLRTNLTFKLKVV